VGDSQAARHRPRVVEVVDERAPDYRTRFYRGRSARVDEIPNPLNVLVTLDTNALGRAVIPVGGGEGWSDNPWSATIKNGRMYGRGTADMKSGVASHIMAVESLLAAGLKPKGDVYINIVVDEEVSGHGTLDTVIRGYKADAGISGETSDLAVQPACIGRIWFEIEIHGKPAGIQKRYEGVSGIDWQMREFERHVARPGYARSLANSAALLRFPEARGDWVRPGIMLYGASPLEDRTAAQIGLRPAMSLTSEIIGIQNLKRGDTVGYGSQFTADREMRIGVVACGYADGYPRHAYNGTPLLVNGVRVPMVGRVSMDMLCVDLRDVPRARIGSPVTLWGAGLPVEEVAAAAGTVSYELLCALARRVPVEDCDGD